MSSLTINGLVPFIPALDLELSQRFYLALGFKELGRTDKMIRLGVPPFEFWLQDYYVKEWAENTMLCLYVDNLDDWWSHIQDMKLDTNFQGKARVLAGPHQQEGGYMLQLSDPAGVLWHLRQGA